ncbi:hypothetical protein [Micromonospora sp. CA-111912]|uniref:hypothetical protein n=1 Tax=Micromonospora sp. CA-111912 TaxID=3239955 RepID=UPI003D8AF9F1
MVIRQRPRRRILPARRQRPGQPPERARATDWMQALSSFVTVIVAIPALVIATVTYRDQQEINRSQIEMAQLERGRFEQRYAARVAYWWVRPAGTRLGPGRFKVQNRSPVPIRGIGMRVTPTQKPGTPVPHIYNVPAAPPCVILTIDLPPLSQDVDMALWINHPPAVELQFTDPTGPWLLSSDGLERDKGAPPNAIRWQSALEVDGTRESAGDCGEGG